MNHGRDDHEASTFGKGRVSRRAVLAGGVGGGVALLAPGRETAGADGPGNGPPNADHYAESVAIAALGSDTERGFDVRLARFPGRGAGSLWMSAYLDGRHYAVTADDLSLSDPGRTQVAASRAEFRVTGSSDARFESIDRETAAMVCSVVASSRAHETPHPPVGEGPVPIRLEATFRALHRAVQVRPGRREVMGRIEATLRVAEQDYRFDVPGKWHEQVGDRPRFAPAFTYLFVQGDGIGIMTSRHAAAAYGFVLEAGQTTAVTAAEIDPIGSPERRFSLTLADGRTLRGVARIRRTVSVPIEGRRRPGATVSVDSDIGPMVGSLNDWNPDL